VHGLTRDRLRALYGERFRYHTVGVDFFDTKLEVWVELTTKGAVSAHKAKGGAYTTCEYGTYKMSKR
jgi:hypothetical protein